MNEPDSNRHPRRSAAARPSSCRSFRSGAVRTRHTRRQSRAHRTGTHEPAPLSDVVPRFVTGARARRQFLPHRCGESGSPHRERRKRNAPGGMPPGGVRSTSGDRCDRSPAIGVTGQSLANAMRTLNAHDGALRPVGRGVSIRLRSKMRFMTGFPGFRAEVRREGRAQYADARPCASGFSRAASASGRAAPARPIALDRRAFVSVPRCCAQ